MSKTVEHVPSFGGELIHHCLGRHEEERAVLSAGTQPCFHVTGRVAAGDRCLALPGCAVLTFKCYSFKEPILTLKQRVQ